MYLLKIGIKHFTSCFKKIYGTLSTEKVILFLQFKKYNQVFLQSASTNCLKYHYNILKKKIKRKKICDLIQTRLTRLNLIYT